jgi:hypothetical protein
LFPEYGITPTSEFDEVKKKKLEEPRGALKKESGRKGRPPSFLSRILGGGHASRTDSSGRPAWVNKPGKLSDYLKEEDWWRLYINPADHDQAQSARPTDPGSHYDRDESHGYKQGMVEAYKRFLDTGKTGRIGHKEYFAMRDAATEHLNENSRAGARKPGDGKFILSKVPINPELDESHPSQPHVAADLKEEKLAGRHVIDDSGENMDAPRGSTKHLTRTQNYAQGKDVFKYIYPAYGSNFGTSNGDIDSREKIFSRKNTAEVKKMVDAAMKRFEKEVAAAPDNSDEVLKAIARAIRVLHVVHPFEDGNGRLNIHLLLPRLLLRHGFPPVVPANMSVLFNGAFTADEIVDELKTAVKNGPRPAE